MITEIARPLPHGITLACRVAGEPGRPVLLFMHGFPEAAFIWDELLEHFSQPENGGYRCVAPFLRGFGPSDAPAEVEAYRAKHLIQDIAALIAIESPDAPLAALVAHDWGGAVAWSVANQHPRLMQRLCIINSPHAGAFLRELQKNPAQQAASRYMHFLCRPDAEALLAEDGFKRMFAMFNDPQGQPPVWMTADERAKYHAVWAKGLKGGCNYYRASPMRPPLSADDPILQLQFAREVLAIHVPTLVMWGMADPALLPALLDGLGDWVPDLRVVPIEGASHWVVQEQPQRVTRELAQFLLSK
ncbi:MAG: alpha/beta fold hydrolase [Acidovorax sp.]